MIHIVCYDISVTDEGGPRRLRRIAKYLERYGNRMQKSVFEVRMEDQMFTLIRRGLLDLIDPQRDNLIIYRISGARDMSIESHGITMKNDLFANMIV